MSAGDGRSNTPGGTDGEERACPFVAPYDSAETHQVLTIASQAELKPAALSLRRLGVEESFMSRRSSNGIIGSPAGLLVGRAVAEERTETFDRMDLPASRPE
jgi:hypothetical protein